MSGRYWITGVQLGILTQGELKDRLESMQEIIDNQFIGNVGDDFTDKIMKLIREEEK